MQLTVEQIAAIETIHAEMRADAIVGQGLYTETLGGLLDRAAETRSDFRFIRLSRPLATPALLTDAQIERYQVLRGNADDPSTNVPDGHDANMWRKHKGCE